MIPAIMLSVLLLLVLGISWLNHRAAAKDADEAHRNLAELLAEQAGDREISDNLDI